MLSFANFYCHHSIHKFLLQYYSNDHLQRILESLCIAPNVSSLRVNTLQATSNQVKAKLQDYFSQRGAHVDTSILPALPECICLTHTFDSFKVY